MLFSAVLASCWTLTLPAPANPKDVIWPFQYDKLLLVCELRLSSENFTLLPPSPAVRMKVPAADMAVMLPSLVASSTKLSSSSLLS